MPIPHWGSEIWTSLDFEWLKGGWVANGPDLESHLKWKPNYLKYGSKRPDFKWPGF